MHGISHSRFWVAEEKKGIPEVRYLQGILPEAINYVRQEHHLPLLGRVGFLDDLARQHSKSMGERASCDHDGFNRRADRIQKELGPIAVGENCYMCPGEIWDSIVAQKVVDVWLKPDGHRDNILNAEYRRTGIGAKFNKGYVYVTQIYTG
jgi:uncharacterized protein YkwD